MTEGFLQLTQSVTKSIGQRADELIGISLNVIKSGRLTQSGFFCRMLRCDCALPEDTKIKDKAVTVHIILNVFSFIPTYDTIK